MYSQDAYNREDRRDREKGHSQRRTGRNAHWKLDHANANFKESVI